MEGINWIEVISNQGFAMALTIYLLTRFEKKLVSLNESIVSLVSTLETFIAK